MTYVVYGDEGSGSCPVECALAEAGLPFETVSVNLKKEEHLTDAYAAINPARKIPALRFPDGRVMTESVAILFALADVAPQSGLLPADRIEAYRWLLYLASQVYPQIEIIDYPERFSPDSSNAERMKDMARERIRSRWALVERAAHEGTMLTTGFSALDIYVAVLSRWAVGEEWRSANLPKVEAVTHAVAARPRIAPIFARHFG